MDFIDHNNPALGFDQPSFDSQAFNDFADLNASGPFNSMNGFSYEDLDMLSFDELYASIPLDGLDQSGSDNAPMLAAFNSGQPNFNTLPTQSPLNVSNQHLTNPPTNGAVQVNETPSSNGSGQAALSASASFVKPSSTTSVNDASQLNGAPSSNNSVQAMRSVSTSIDKPASTVSVNRSAQPASNNLPLHAPHRKVPYNPSIGIPYTPEDTEADKIKKWENLIARADLANAGVPASASQIIEEESAEESLQTVDSPNSLFDSPRSSSVEVVETPSPTPPTPSSSQAPAPTMAPSKASKNVIARATRHAVQLPRALTSQKNYAQHVSPFAPVATVAPPVPSAPTSRELEKARSRIQSLAKERNFYQRNLRKATSVDPKTGKNTLQTLQAQNVALQRANTKQERDMKEMQEMLKEGHRQYALLSDRFNELAKEMHKARLELDELRR
ncbi:uncharacterized protein N7500_008678 [Penicillium coprophilum]|uniref:uncharacterized protein n=1 Tax=Penicillium coprophilum TaxID=36646 RepID=UPI0023A661D6|nr:uncharacterized protein N7500_008678 [Penicillium coprophilum]KAJ5159027.1 hypothetical protein N7500_008678 [Penicillium coprophilum]